MTLGADERYPGHLLRVGWWHRPYSYVPTCSVPAAGVKIPCQLIEKLFAVFDLLRCVFFYKIYDVE